MSKMLKVVGASWAQTKASSYILGTLGILAILALFVGEIERSEDDGNYAATVYWDAKTGFRIEYWGQSNQLETISRGVARAYYRTDKDTTGWSYLEIETDGSYDDWVQAYAAGLLEGALAWQDIRTHIINTVEQSCDHAPKMCDKLKDALDKSALNLKAKANENDETDPFWHQISLYFYQIDGIYKGWLYGVERSRNNYEIEKADLYWLNAASEMDDIAKNLKIQLGYSLNQKPALSSAFAKIVKEDISLHQNTTKPKKKILFAQNSVGNYASMNRLLKRYELNYHETANKESPLVRGTTVEFPSNPGAIVSQDQMFIVRGSGEVPHLLGITGTDLNNYNPGLWADIDIFNQVLLGPRIAAANHLATDARSWVHILARNNSGTCLRQWMVIDYTKLDSASSSSHRAVDTEDGLEVRTEIQEIDSEVLHTIIHREASEGAPSGLVVLVEQLPRLTHSGDYSAALFHQGYWANYGEPHFKDIKVALGITQVEDMCGVTESTRKKIFAELAPNVTTAMSILKMMRNTSNSHSNQIEFSFIDNIEEGPNTAIWDKMICLLYESSQTAPLSYRGDLKEKSPEAFGVIDTKVASGTSGGELEQFLAVSGPAFTIIEKNDSQSDVPSNTYNFTPVQVNKGNVATTHNTEDSKDSFLGLLDTGELQEQMGTAAGNPSLVLPFQWSKSPFANESHLELPDIWAFPPVKPNWVW